MRKTKVLSLMTITALSFTLNGCLIDKINQRLHPKSQMKKTVTDSKQKLPTTALSAQNRIAAVKEYTPSKPSAPIYKESQKTVAKSKKSKKKTYIKKHTKTKKVSKSKVLAPEPYSIEKHEKDPELLGPQTTLKSNPLTKKSDLSSDKKVKKG